MDNIVLDKSKFKLVSTQNDIYKFVSKKENFIVKYLKTHVESFLPPSVFNELVPSGSQPGIIYGLCKVHKPGFPLRPVVSMIQTAEYNLAYYLDEIIQPHIPRTFMLDPTSSFMDRLKSETFNQSQSLVSYDVVSLFTNIPLAETIDLICNCLYESSSEISEGNF